MRKTRLNKWERILAILGGLFSVAFSGYATYAFFVIDGFLVVLLLLPLIATSVLSFSFGCSALLVGVFPNREFEIQRLFVAPGGKG